MAEGCGLPALRIERPERCAEQLREALAMPGPVLVEAIVDPDEPPMPPAFEIEQALNLVRAVAKGTRRGGRILKTIAADKARELT